MQPLNDAARLLRVPSFLPAATAVLLVVLGQAVSGTFFALFAVRRAGMSPLELSVFLTASALMSIAASTLLGRRFDRHPDAAALLIVLAMNAAGFALLAVTTDFIWLVAIAAIPVGVGGAAFTLLFALAKRQLDAVDAITAERGVAALRMLSSLGWAIGPALGAILVSYRGYPGVFLGAAICIVISLVTVVVSGIWRLPESARAATMPDTVSVPKGRAALAVGSIGLFHMAMFMGSIALSITAVERLGGTESDVGLLFSLCAALEVLVMGCFVIRPTRGSRKLWMVSGFALFALYYVALIVFPTLAMAYWAQIPRALAIGIVSVVGMIYMQSLMPSRVGLAAALFSNAVSVGAILSGALTGPWASALGYASVFWFCVALTVAGAILILIRSSRDGQLR
jgi:SET family sugar efflux transporter-like MFS transporter